MSATTDRLVTDAWRAIGYSMVGRSFAFTHFPRCTFKVLGRSIVAGRVLILERGQTRRSVDAAQLAQCLEMGALEETR